MQLDSLDVARVAATLNNAFLLHGNTAVVSIQADTYCSTVLPPGFNVQCMIYGATLRGWCEASQCGRQWSGYSTGVGSECACPRVAGGAWAAAVRPRRRT